MTPAADRSGLSSIRRDMEFLCRTVGRRLAGWPEEERAADYMVRRMRGLGLANVAKLPFSMTRWRPRPAHLVRLDDGRRLRVEHVTHSAATPRGGVEGDLTVFEPVEYQAGLRRSGLDGKIGLFHGGYGDSARLFRQLNDSPLAALLIVDTRMQTTWPIANGMGERYMKLARKPVACLSLMDAWALVRDGIRRVRLECTGRSEPAVSWNVTGDIPGTDSAGRILVLSGHLDSVSVGEGADDNASGIAATLECARRLRRRRLRHTLRFIGFGAEEQLSVGAMRYVREQAGDLDRVGFVCNFDAIAAWFGQSVAFCTGTPAMDRFVRDTVERKLQFGTIHSGVTPFQDMFPFAAEGVPGVWLTRKTQQAGYWYHHSVYNCLKEMSMEQIARSAEVGCALVGDLAARRDWPFPRRLAPALRRRCRRYLADMF